MSDNIRLRLHLLKRAVITYSPYIGSKIQVEIMADGTIKVNDNGLYREYHLDRIKAERILQDSFCEIFSAELPEQESSKSEDTVWKVEFYNRMRLDHIAYGTNEASLDLLNSLIRILEDIEWCTGANLGVKYLESGYEKLIEEEGKPAVVSEEMQKSYFHIMSVLMNKIMEKNGGSDSNVMLSPLSMIYAFAMILEASEGETREEILSLFDGHFDQMEEGLFALTEDCGRRKSQLKVANALHIDAEYQKLVVSSYVDTISRKYLAEYIRAERSDLVDMINGWVSKHTDGMIKRLVSDGELLENVTLLNAVSFKAEWRKEYKSRDIETDDFHNADGSISKVNMLCSNESTLLYSTKVIGFLKSYKGTEYYYAGILPRENYTVEKIIRETSSEDWRCLFKRAQRASVDVRIPEYEFEYQADYSKILSEMGILSAFDREKANLRKMITAEETYIKKIIQKTYIDVNRKGTRAAAVTGVVCAAAGGIPMEFYEVHLNRPFIFAIVHGHSGLPVFVGVVNECWR